MFYFFPSTPTYSYIPSTHCDPYRETVFRAAVAFATSNNVLYKKAKNRENKFSTKESVVQ